ncbi:hypothetical protein LPB90_18350 [Chryseobacterium sp. LC2016-29]|uniref:hypothetical protein n=1 Tax=Chryseobacterium sp. LC2016-29 TaxID=2897331 RepID=UPI001E416A90|nr:hypothetical protein [Chryseobacterium sp. LC2016-29]MCD0480404.1 hypothetical protein [Chryseobacterium sp. LC2016-29]
MEIELKLDDLEMSEESKKIIENSKFVPIMMVTPKSAIVDEGNFLFRKYSDDEKKAFYECAIALNNHLNKSI